jgi:hypothetical protein
MNTHCQDEHQHRDDHAAFSACRPSSSPAQTRPTFVATGWSRPLGDGGLGEEVGTERLQLNGGEDLGPMPLSDAGKTDWALDFDAWAVPTALPRIARGAGTMLYRAPSRARLGR